MRAACIAMATWAALAATGPLAQYPNKPVHLVSPVSAGSGADSLARIIGQGLAKALGRPVLVENKPGAEGAIAARSVATAPADGHTLLFGGSSTYVLPLVVKPAPFAVTDLAPVSTVGGITYGLFVHPSLPARSLDEFIAHARANPGKLNYGSVNIATELAASHLMKATGIELTKVPYKGGGQVMGDLIAGRVHLFFGPVANGLPYAADGRLHLIATHPQRSTLARDVPTIAEQGIALAFRPLHYMILVPARTPAETMERLSQAMSSVLEDDEVRAQLEKQGVSIQSSSPEQAAALVQEGIGMWMAFVREVSPGIR